MIAIQMLGLVIGLSAIYLTHLYYKRDSFTKKELVFWLIVWLCFILVSLFPEIASPVTGYLKLQRSMDLIMIVAFVILFSLAFHNYVATKKQETKLEKLVREIALKDLDK